MADFKPEFKKTILDHGTLKLTRFHKDVKKLTSFGAQMSGSAIHFTQWTKEGGAPLRARFDLGSLSTVAQAIMMAIKSPGPCCYNMECDAKPKDKEKFLEGILLVTKDDKGIINIGICKPGVPFENAETFAMMPNYFVRLFSYNKDSNANDRVSAAEVSAHFARDIVGTWRDLAKTVAAINYVSTSKDDSGDSSSSGSSSSSSSGSNSGYTANNSASSSYDNEFGEGF